MLAVCISVDEWVGTTEAEGFGCIWVAFPGFPSRPSLFQKRLMLCHNHNRHEKRKCCGFFFTKGSDDGTDIMGIIFPTCQMLPICPDHPCDSNSAECETCRWVSQLHQCPQFSLSICLLLVWQHHRCDTLCVYLLPLENTQGLSGWILWQWPLSHRSSQLSCQKGTGS